MNIMKAIIAITINAHIPIISQIYHEILYLIWVHIQTALFIGVSEHLVWRLSFNIQQQLLIHVITVFKQVIDCKGFYCSWEELEDT